MAATEIPLQDVPANGQDLAITWTTGADEMLLPRNTGNQILLARNVSSPSAAVTVDVEGVPASDSGRDETISYALAAASDVKAGGPFKPGNFNNAGGGIDLAVSSGLAADLEVAWVQILRV
jgi:hypothetical protein